MKDADFGRFYRDYVSTDNFHSYDRKYLLGEILKLCEHVPGDTAECGVYEGAGSCLIGRHAGLRGRLHHMFDSFEGLSQPEAVDGIYWKRGAMSVPEDRVRERLKELENLRYWRGWIPERFHEVADRRFNFFPPSVGFFLPPFPPLSLFSPTMKSRGLLL